MLEQVENFLTMPIGHIPLYAFALLIAFFAFLGGGRRDRR